MRLRGHPRLLRQAGPFTRSIPQGYSRPQFQLDDNCLYWTEPCDGFEFSDIAQNENAQVLRKALHDMPAHLVRDTKGITQL